MGNICSVCGYIALKSKVPDKCPVCGSPKTAFKEREDAVQTPKDPENLEGLELKHVPQITKTECGIIKGECLDIHVLMGKVVHPMQEDHYISHIDFYIDEEFAGRVMLTTHAQPAGSLHLKKDRGKLTVIESCNIHGNWINSISL